MCVCACDAGALCVHVHDCLCVLAHALTNQTNTAGLPHVVCLIVCLPWRRFYQTFVCKQISIKLSAFCNHIVCARVRMGGLAHVF